MTELSAGILLYRRGTGHADGTATAERAGGHVDATATAGRAAGRAAGRPAGRPEVGLGLKQVSGGADSGSVEVLLVHPGGPYWAKRDAGAWSIPKGIVGADEDPLEAARREFKEETGSSVGGAADFLDLGESRQPGGKVVHAWAVEGDLDAERLTSNTFDMEWPPRSGRRCTYPEVDRGGWFTLPAADEKILEGQREFLLRLAGRLAEG